MAEFQRLRRCPMLRLVCVVVCPIACVVGSDTKNAEDGLSPSELEACVSWAQRPANASSILFRKMSDCQLKHVSPGRPTVWNRFSGQMRAPPDAISMCSVVSFLTSIGRLPSRQEVENRDLALFDVGAMGGGELVLGHRLGFRVLSFEARQVEWNRLHNAWSSLDRVQIIRAAVSDVAGFGYLQLFNADDSSSLHKAAVSAGKEKAKVEKESTRGNALVQNVTAMSLDYASAVYLPKGQRVAFIKVDVQGHEYEVLKSAIRLLQSDHPALYFEYNPAFRGADAPKILCFVKRLGYECRYLGNMFLCI